MTMYHLTINGRPFCEWKGCMAAADPGASAWDAEKLKRLGVMNVAVVKGECPVANADADAAIASWEGRDK
jgi:hypothetical protein